MEEKQIWQFNYHRGREMKTGYVRASNQEYAYLVAVAVCEKNKWRGPTNPTPFILGDESILLEDTPGVGRGSELVQPSRKYA